MSVLHLLGSPGEGGAETYFMSLLEALGEAGVSQAAGIHQNAGREAGLRRLGIPTEVYPFARPIDLRTPGMIRRFATRLRAPLLLPWMSRAGSLAPSGPWKRVARIGGYYHLKYYRNMDHLVVNTEEIGDFLVGNGWPRERLSYIPNFAVADPHPPLDRATLDTPEGVPLLLAMGRLHSDKAHDITLKALARLPDAWLWIAGSGPLEQPLKRLAADLGVAERVRFLGWRTDAGALYRAADICLFPSRIEPLGNVVIQAWAHGTPIVVAASKGPAALVHDKVDGLVVPIDDAEALAAAAASLIADASLRQALSRHGALELERSYAKAHVVEAWKALFARFGADGS